MRNLLIWALMGVLLLSGTAFATDDDMWDDDDVIKPAPGTQEDSREPAEVEVISPAATASGHMGMYFGADGHFEHGYSEGYSRDRAVDYNGQTIYFPEYGRSGSQLYENVYGPMWGVPADAVGMEGYDPYYYYLMTMADPSQLTADQRKMIDEQMQGGNVRHGERIEASHDQAEANVQEGINMSDDYWD